MYLEVRVIYKDGKCAVFDKCMLCAIGDKSTLIKPSNLLKDTININSYEHIKAIKVAIKEGNVWT